MLERGAEADCQSAIQQAGSLRYGQASAKPATEVIVETLSAIEEGRA
jgi:hypothetical protein